jgi:hypothetical protein
MNACGQNPGCAPRIARTFNWPAGCFSLRRQTPGRPRFFIRLFSNKISDKIFLKSKFYFFLAIGSRLPVFVTAARWNFFADLNLMFESRAKPITYSALKPIDQPK